MADDLVIVPSNGDGFVNLARHKTGRLFRKHLLNYGPLLHPKTGAVITVDDAFAAKMKANFDNRICDIVQVPLANGQNEHTEDPERNIGEVVDIEVKDQKVYAVLDVRDDKHAEKLGKTYLGASAMLSLDYTDTKTGTKVGPTLLHACVTNRPYVTGLEDYQEIVAATSDSSQETTVLLTTDTVAAKPSAPPTKEQTPEATDMPETAETTQETTKPSLEDLLNTLKTEHDIDVTGLQAKAAEGDQATALTNALTKALSDAGVVKLSNTDDADVSTDTIVGAVAEVAGKVVSLTNQVETLQRRDAEHAVDALVESGRVLPAQKAGFVELKLSNPTMFDSLIPAEPIVKLSNEQGVTPPKDDKHIKDVDAEIMRLSALIGQTPAKK